jgi:Protein of unknown function (DUF3071)
MKEQDLTLVGLTEDRQKLVLISDSGEEFTLPADARLRAALRGEHARLGQLEITMESALRPRDIQARIRAGETPESVAAAAQTTIDKVMGYATPVLAERAHVADRAQRASVRRKGSDSPARVLGDAVAERLRSRNIDPDAVEWDAWRREDGRWTLTATFQAGVREGQAAFTFDAPGNYVSAEDDDARWLTGDGGAAHEAAPAASKDDLSAARRRRLSAVPPDQVADAPGAQVPLGEDAIDLVTESPPETAALGAEAPVEAYLDDPDPLARTSELDRVDDDQADDGEPAEESAGRPARRKGRASVPSWDEIMFGGGKHD